MKKINKWSLLYPTKYVACLRHTDVGYKKGCPECFRLNNKNYELDDGNWVHDSDMECR